MILASHAIIGAALGRISPSPILSLFLGLLSHYTADAIPHWEYNVPSLSGANTLPHNKEKKKSRFTLDTSLAILDLILGILLAFALFKNDIGESGRFLSIAAGIAGGVLPDGFQFLYLFFKREPLTTHQKFHDAIHAKKKLNNRPIFGIFLQAIIAAGSVIFSNLIL